MAERKTKRDRPKMLKIKLEKIASIEKKIGRSKKHERLCKHCRSLGVNFSVFLSFSKCLNMRDRIRTYDN
jgi:hypothetical protein